MVPIGSPDAALLKQSITRGQELEFLKIQGRGEAGWSRCWLWALDVQARAAPTYLGKAGLPPPLYQVIAPTGKIELLKLPSGVPHRFFSTETQSGGAAAPATQY